MKKRIRSCSIILLFIFISCSVFAGCAGKKFNLSSDTVLEQSDSNSSYGYASNQSVTFTKTDVASTAGAGTKLKGSLNPVTSASSGYLPDVSEKLIYTGSIGIETKEFDKTVSAAKELAGKLGGFIENSNVTGDTYYTSGTDTATVINRNATITYRVPQKKFDAFFNSAGSLGNVVSSSMNVENITSQYIDTEARLNTLKVEEQRLLALLEKSGKLEDLITIESKLSDVRYQIESQTSTLRQMQTQVDYSTISLSIREVSDYSDNVPAVRTFLQRLGDAFKDSWKGFVRFIQNLVIGIARNLPGMLFVGIVVMVVWIWAKKRAAKKRLERKTAEPERPEKDESKGTND